MWLVIAADQVIDDNPETGLDVEHATAVRDGPVRRIAIAGGVAANSGLKQALQDAAREYGWNVYIPRFEYTMDNAAMIAIVGYYKYLRGEFEDLDAVPSARLKY